MSLNTTILRILMAVQAIPRAGEAVQVDDIWFSPIQVADRVIYHGITRTEIPKDYKVTLGGRVHTLKTDEWMLHILDPDDFREAKNWLSDRWEFDGDEEQFKRDAVLFILAIPDKVKA